MLETERGQVRRQLFELVVSAIEGFGQGFGGDGSVHNLQLIRCEWFSSNVETGLRGQAGNLKFTVGNSQFHMSCVLADVHVSVYNFNGSWFSQRQGAFFIILRLVGHMCSARVHFGWFGLHVP